MMRAKQHFLTALGALTLCSGAAIAAAQDEGRQPSPETTTQPSLPQSMPPEQANMEDQMLTRGEAERSSSEQSQPPSAQDSADENVAHLVQGSSGSGVQSARSKSVPQPSYPQQTEDELSGRRSSDSVAETAGEPAAQSDTQSESRMVVQASTAQAPQPMQEQSAPPQRTSTLDETSVTRSSSAPAPTTAEQPVQSESAMDQGNTQLSDATASVQAKFDAIDADHDGTIDRQEAAASDALASQFDALDSSGDGKLSLAEFTAASNLASIRVDRKVHQE